MPQPKRPDLQPDAVVEALVSDPAQGPPATTVLHGFLGKSPTEGVWRLYLTASLDEYVEIPESEIQHSETLPDSSGTTVWVSSSVSLKHVRTHAQDVQAEFLGGAITDELLATARGPVAPPQPIPTPPVSLAGPCLSQQVRCQSAVDACPSRFGRCLSQQVRCQSAVDACPSRFGCASRLCPPATHELCQTIGIACVPSVLVACPQTVAGGCQVSAVGICRTPPVSAPNACPTVGVCPSIAGCPSEGFCGDPFDPGQFGGGPIG